ncbi:MAG TPA: helix-turn-helix domain-containing protein [Humisphaera sp.]|jgi:putative transcriptional regulator|nr:helix-turn-helix domain-containing protein [Humisphaera sp.]
MSATRKITKAASAPSPSEQIRASLDEIVGAIKSGDHSRLTVRQVEVPSPRQYSARAVRSLRNRLAVSQRLFADLVGVSPELVEHWEQGRRKPARIACRLLDQIASDPERYVASLVRRRTVA